MYLSRFNIWPNIKEPTKICQKVQIVCKRGKISPHLVTLSIGDNLRKIWCFDDSENEALVLWLKEEAHIRRLQV